MMDTITFLDKNGKYSVYTGGNINGLYCYLEIIGDPNNFTNLVQSSHNFGTLSSINNDTSPIHPVIVDLQMIQKII